jgi:acetate kinase
LIFSGGTGEYNEKIREKIREKMNKLGFNPEIQVVHIEEDWEMVRQIS